MIRTVADKMGIKPEHGVFIADGPADSIAGINLPSSHSSLLDSEMSYDHVIWFVKTQDAMNSQFDVFKDLIFKTGKLWVAWPKASKLGTDLNIKHVIKIGYDNGLVESTNLRIDDTWTALKFTYPKPGKTYNNSYGTLQ